MDQTEAEGFACEHAARHDAEPQNVNSASDEDALADGFFNDGLGGTAQEPQQQQQQQLPPTTIPTTRAHISFQNDFWEQIAKIDKDRLSFESEMKSRQSSNDKEVATLRRDAAKAAADAQQMSATVLDQLGHAQTRFEATAKRAEELRVEDQAAAAAAVSAAATASAASTGGSGGSKGMGKGEFKKEFL